MNEELLDELHIEAENLIQLLKDRQLGLVTWKILLAETLQEIEILILRVKLGI